VARNSQDPYRPCPCGSGEKFKFCCRDKAREEAIDLVKGRSAEALERAAPEAERCFLEGRRLLDLERADDAIPCFEKAIRLVPIIAAPYNNLALARYIRGEYSEAIALEEKVDRVIDPGNAFALGSLVHYYLIVGRDEEAGRALDRLERCDLPDESQAWKKCEALARLGRHEAILRTALAWRPHCSFFAGIAAANLGRYDEAKGLLEETLGERATVARARESLDLLSKGRGPGTLDGTWTYLDVHEWMYRGGPDRLRDPEQLRRLPGLVRALEIVLNEDPSDPRPLDALRSIGSPRAIELLRKVALGTWGTKDVRFHALMCLGELGVLGKEPVRVWDGNEWRDIRLNSMEIKPPGPAPSTDFAERLAEMSRLNLAERWKEAVALGRRLAEEAPQLPQPRYNLAIALRAIGREEDAEKIIKELVARFPDYLFARAALVSLRIQQKRIDEADELVRTASVPAETTIEGQTTWCAACVQMAFAHKDATQMRDSIRALRSLDPKHPLLKEIDGSFIGSLLEFAEMQELYARRREERARSRLLAPAATLADCLAALPVHELSRIADALGHPARGRKKAILETTLRAMEDPATVRRALGGLSISARSALSWLLSSGGVESFAEFTRRHSAAGKEKSDPLGELRAVGFVAVGTIGGQQSVLIPGDLRGLLAAAFSGAEAR